MLLRSANRQQVFQIGRYSIALILFYFLPLWYVKLFQTPKKLLDVYSASPNVEKSKVTVCPNDVDQVEAPSSTIGCVGKNCEVRNVISCPGPSDSSDMFYCCQAWRFDNTWVECCDANTFGVMHNTTKNIAFIYFLVILCPIFAILCCPCSPVFRKFRQKLWRMRKGNIDNEDCKQNHSVKEEEKQNTNYLHCQPQSLKLGNVYVT